MKFKTLALTAFAVTTFGCGKGTNPSTAEKSDLNPPGQLVSVTGDKSVQLRWTTGNAEKDLQGYYVFMAKDTLADLKTKIKYPSGTVDINSVRLPRCKDNNDFFAAFGFSASTSDCPSSTSLYASKFAGAQLLTGDSSNAGATGSDSSDSGGTGSDASSISNQVKCDGNTGSLSLNVTPPSFGERTCTISNLQDGVTYSFFVVAVSGSKNDKISWSSNFIEDTPSATAFNGTIKLNGNDGTNAAQYVVFSLDTQNYTTIATPTPQDCSGASDPICRLTTANNAATDGVYLARDANSTSYQQRLFISTSTNGTVQIQPRGKQTYDPDQKTPQPRIPGDQAVDNAKYSYPAKGTKFAVYDNEVFDLMFQGADGKTHYGKLFVNDDLSYATGADASATKKAASTVGITIVLQPQATQTEYFN